jgi:hypothetical protein
MRERYCMIIVILDVSKEYSLKFIVGSGKIS